MQSIVLDNDVFVIEHTLPPHNDVFTAPAAFFHYEGWGVLKSKGNLAALLRIAAVLLRKTDRSRPLFAVSGAKASAIAYSIAETAKANHLKPYEYFRYLLEELPRHGELEELSYVEQLLPWSETLPECCYQKKHPSTD